MRLLLVQNLLYVPALGGANKANRMLLEQLAARGHICRALASEHGAQGGASTTDLRQRLGIHARRRPDGLREFSLNGVSVRTLAEGQSLPALVPSEIDDFRPDVILTSSEDPGQALLKAALQGAAPVVYIAHTPQMLPFGPRSFVPSETGTALLRRAHGIISCGSSLREFIRAESGLDSVVVRFLYYGDGPFPILGRPDRGAVTIINPCAIKGISIFLALARRLPHVRFAAVPAWGTNAADLEALRVLPNVTLRQPAEDIAEILREIHTLLVPSLWHEGLPRVVFEAMMHGIPVLASDTPPLREATLGLNCVLPVRPIEHYLQDFDDKMMPSAVVPPQPIEPWVDAVTRLQDPGEYARVSAESSVAAARFLADNRVEIAERYLEGVIARLPRPPEDDAADPRARAGDATARRVTTLSAERRALLEKRLARTARATTPDAR